MRALADKDALTARPRHVGQLAHAAHERLERHRRDLRLHAEQVCARAEVLGACRDCRPQASPRAIATHRAAHPSVHRVRDARWSLGGVGEIPQRDRTAAMPTGPGEGGEARTVANSPDQAVSRLRPRRRRALITTRPPRERIRTRNPCVFLRLRLLGGNVRFTHGLLGTAAPERPEVGGPAAACGTSVRATRWRSQRGARDARGPAHVPARQKMRARLHVHARGGTFRPARRSRTRCA